MHKSKLTAKITPRVSGQPWNRAEEWHSHLWNQCLYLDVQCTATSIQWILVCNEISHLDSPGLLQTEWMFPGLSERLKFSESQIKLAVCRHRLRNVFEIILVFLFNLDMLLYLRNCSIHCDFNSNDCWTTHTQKKILGDEFLKGN